MEMWAQTDPQFLSDALHCQEEYWEGEEPEEESNCSGICSPEQSNLLLEQDLYWEDEELTSLLSREQKNPLCNLLKTNPSLAGARTEAVEWMLKVNSYFSFSALTAILAVNYLDRFFSGFSFHSEKPWMTQLAAVACLSLAAKVEETHVPLLLDLQVGESRYVFEAKTIQRMEMLVLSTLQWKMNPVTPLSFLDHITRRLGLIEPPICGEFLNRSECLLLSVISDSRYMCYLPSVLAAATMQHAVNGVLPCFAAEFQDQLLATLGVDKEKLEDCFKLISESKSGFPGRRSSHKRKFRQMVPGSPNGVMDVCFSSDSSNESWALAAKSVSSSPEPLSKKIKAEDHDNMQSLRSPEPLKKVFDLQSSA